MVKTLEQTVGEFLDQCSPTKVETTRAAYRDALNRFFAAGKLVNLEDVKQLEPENFPEVVRELNKTFKPATVAHAVTTARQLYKFLFQEDRTIVDPTQGFKSKPLENVPDWNVLHTGETAQLLALITDLRDLAIVSSLALQGWRVSGLCGLKWGDIREEPDGLVAQFHTKRKKLIVQGVQKAVFEAARVWAVSNPATSQMLPKHPFVAAGGKIVRGLTRAEVYGVVTRYSKKFGRRITPHGLRATYISSVIARKGIEVARQLAGHKNITTTQRYSRWQVQRDDPLTVDDL